MKKMTPYLSDKLKVLSFVSIIMVIYIHTYYTEGENYATLLFIENLIGGSIARIAVPLFYLISGYLLFLRLDSLAVCIKKIKKRMRTLLVPYLLTNTLALGFYLFLDFLSRLIPIFGGAMNFHVLTWFDAGFGQVFYNTYWGPIAYQLWFVRDMLIFIWLLPIIQYVLRYIMSSSMATIIGLVALWMVQASCGLLVLWMAIGGLLALGQVFDMTKIRSNRYLAWGSTLFFVALSLAHTVGVLADKYIALPITIGIVSIWYLYDIIAKDRIFCQAGKGKILTGYTFFIYLSHIPLLLIFKKLPLLFGSGEPMLVCCYLIVPLLFVGFAILLGMTLKKNYGKLYLLYTGGR